MIKIIAEIGQNHNGDIVLAKELIGAAKDNGADIAKFQVYDAKSLFSKKSEKRKFRKNTKSHVFEGCNH